VIVVVAGCFNSSTPPPPISNQGSAEPAKSPPSRTERWTGTGVQPDANLSFSIEMQILREVPVGERLGTIKYDADALHCTADLIRTASAEGIVVVERMTTNPENQCVDGGSIVLHRKGESLDWVWSYPDGTVGATATLRWTAP
jgi:hypothetical protein